jgi:hypothetical protein
LLEINLKKLQLLILWNLTDYNIQTSKVYFLGVFFTMNFYTPKLMKLDGLLSFLGVFQLTSKSSCANMAQILTPYL